MFSKEIDWICRGIWEGFEAIFQWILRMCGFVDKEWKFAQFESISFGILSSKDNIIDRIAWIH